MGVFEFRYLVMKAGFQGVFGRVASRGPFPNLALYVSTHV
jgi:hypothetical protein